MTDSYIYIIIALLPIAALMSVLQVNPYNALVIRAILGAVAVLVYAVLGAADVALTEALVGTMLAVTLYVIAVRSSLVMRLGIVRNQLDFNTKVDLPLPGIQIEKNPELQENLGFIRQTLFKDFEIKQNNDVPEIITSLKKIIQKYYLRLELVEYPNSQALEFALMSKEVHAVCYKNNHITLRIHRLFEILENELDTSAAILEYKIISNEEKKH